MYLRAKKLTVPGSERHVQRATAWSRVYRDIKSKATRANVR